MKILILGAGGVGGYFGARLIDAGVDVTFLVRARRAVQLREHGLTVHAASGQLHLPSVKFIEPHTSSTQHFDVVILCCKAYDLTSSIAAITPYVDDATVVLPLLNGMRHLEILDKVFGTRVLGGLAQVSTTLLANGDIQQITSVHTLIYGARESSHALIVERLDAAMKIAKFESRLSQHITLEMWEKFVLLATLAGATCLLRANVGEIAGTTDGRRLVSELLSDCAAVAKAAGYAPREPVFGIFLDALTQPNSLLEASMRRDMEQGRTTEAEHVLGDLLQRAMAAGIESTLLRAAYCHMQAHEQRLLSKQQGTP